MNVYLDTDVLVDCLRGSSTAKVWLESSFEETFQVPGVVAIELLWGCRNQTELDRTHSFLNSFDLIWPEALEFAHAYELMAMHRLSSGLCLAIPKFFDPPSVYSQSEIRNPQFLLCALCVFAV